LRRFWIPHWPPYQSTHSLVTPSCRNLGHSASNRELTCDVTTQVSHQTLILSSPCCLFPKDRHGLSFARNNNNVTQLSGNYCIECCQAPQIWSECVTCCCSLEDVLVSYILRHLSFLFWSDR